MSWLPGSTQMYSQGSNQGFPCTRQSTQLLAERRQGGSVAGYWQTRLKHLENQKILQNAFYFPSNHLRLVGNCVLGIFTQSIAN